MPRIYAYDWEDRERKDIARAVKEATKHTQSAGGVTIEVLEYKPGNLLVAPAGSSAPIRSKPARDYVVLHWTAGLGTNPDHFTNTRFTVAYYVGITGQIFKYFDETKYVSWHAANTWVNDASVGIELASPGLLYTGPKHGHGEPKEYMYHEASNSAENGIYCKVSDTHLYKKIGNKYYALFGKAQTEATVQLVKYLCAKLNVPANILPEDKRGKNIPIKEIKSYRGILTHWNCVGPDGHSDELLQFDWALLKYALEAKEWQPSGNGSAPAPTDAKSDANQIPKSPPKPKESPSKPKTEAPKTDPKKTSAPSDPPAGTKEVTFHVGSKPGHVLISVNPNEPPKPGEDKPMSAPQPETQLRERAVKLASSLLDTPYIWGGDNPKHGLDCSGLIVYIFQTLGILKGDTTAQGLRAKWPDKGNDPGAAKPGDLIYYGKEAKATHVTMYVGDEMCIGANGGGSACVTVEIAAKKNAKVKRVKWNYRKDYLGFAPIPPLDDPDKKPLPKDTKPKPEGDAAGKAVAERARAFVLEHGKDGAEPIAYNPDMADDDPGGGSIAPYGFVSYIHGRAGVALPHAKYDKWIEKATRRGQIVARGAEKPGDVAMMPDQAAIYTGDGKWAGLSKEKGAGLFPLVDLEKEAGPTTAFIRPSAAKTEPPPQLGKRYDVFMQAVESVYPMSWKTEPMQMNVVGVAGYRAGKRIANPPNLYNDTIALCYVDTDGHKYCAEFLATVDPPNKEDGTAENHLEYGQYTYKKGKVKDPDTDEEYDAFVPEGQVTIWKDEGDGIRRKDTPTEKGDFPIHLRAGGLGYAVPLSSQGAQLIWGGTGMGTPWSVFYSLARRDPDGTFTYTFLDSDNMGDAIAGAGKPSEKPAPTQQAPTVTPAPSESGADAPTGPFGKLVFSFRGQNKYTYAFTAEDMLWLGRLVTGEAGGTDDPDNRAVVWTMLNRFAFFTHTVYPTFHKFVRAYSTPLQPVLNSWGAAKRHQNNPDFEPEADGSTYKDHPEVKRGQLKKFKKLQATPWSKLPAGARALAQAVMRGTVLNPIKNASEFANTATYYKDKHGTKPDRTEWLAFTTQFAKDKKWAWIGEVPGLDQIKENAFFADLRKVGGDKNAPRYPEVDEALVRVVAAGGDESPPPPTQQTAPVIDPGPVSSPSDENDPAIEALNLAPTARTAAYILKGKHPGTVFNSGRRGKDDQARAMAGNVVKNRKWIEETYSDGTAAKACQKWVDEHPEAKTKDAIAEGLRGVLKGLSDAQVAAMSKHINGMAFDIQVVETDAAKIKEDIRALPGLHKFLEKEGGLVIWHAQFK